MLLPPFLSGPPVGTGVTIAAVVAGVPKLSTLLSLIQTYPTIRTVCTNASTSGTLFAPDNEVSLGAFLLHPRSHSGTTQPFLPEALLGSSRPLVQQHNLLTHLCAAA